LAVARKSPQNEQQPRQLKNNFSQWQVFGRHWRQQCCTPADLHCECEVG